MPLTVSFQLSDRDLKYFADRMKEAKSKAAGYVIWVWPNDRSLENRAAYDQFLRDGIDGLNINFPTQGVAAAREFVPTTS